MSQFVAHGGSGVAIVNRFWVGVVEAGRLHDGRRKGDAVHVGSVPANAAYSIVENLFMYCRTSQ